MDVHIKPLLILSAIDAPPKFLQSLQEAGKFVKKLRETDPDIVNSAANRSGTEEEHRAIQAGLLYLALTEPDKRRSLCTDVVLTSRDSLTYVLSEITRLVAETWPKLPQPVRVNLLSFLNDLISSRASVEVLMLHIYRRMSCGDLSHPNVWLVESILEILEKNKEFLCSLERQTFLLPLTVITFLRLIPDHYGSQVSNQPAGTTQQNQTSLKTLRTREVVFCEDLIRKHFDRCALIGRDFIRLLHGVSRLDLMNTLWNDMLQNLPSLSSHFSDVSDVLEITTPQFYTQTLIPHEMEQWARWMMKNVHCVPRVPVNRYQEFFQRKFFASPESQSLRVCLLRYIVTYFYPDNEMLASSLIPRWNMISWILSQSTCQVVTANAKLALFYDWLFFKSNDCIMNLEPALLAMMNHLAPRTQPIALSLVDFLVKIVPNYYAPMTDRIIAGVRGGLEEMTRLGVIKNISPLFEMLYRTAPELFRVLRVLLGGETSPLQLGSMEVVPNRPSPGDAIEASIDPLSVGTPALTTHPPSVVPISPTNVISPAVSVRRPSTPPLASSKPKQGSGETGTLVDPRLVRGHAAITANTGANVPSIPSSTAPILNNKPPPVTVPTSSVPEAPGIAILSPAEPLLDLPPVIPNSLLQPPVLTSLPSVTLPEEPRPRASTIPKRRTAPILMESSAAKSNAPPASPDPILADVDLDRLDIDRFQSDKDTKIIRASWSPPPLPSTNAIAYRSQPDQMPETPESIELNIDNLRRRFQEYQLRYHYSVEPVNVNDLINLLDGPIRTSLEKFRDLAIRLELVRNSGSMVCADRPNDDLDEVVSDVGLDFRNSSGHLRSATVLLDLSDAMEDLVQAVLAEDSFDDLEIAGRTASVVCELLYPLFAERLMPLGTEWSEEKLEDCLAFPIFVPFRHLWEMNPGDPKRELLLLLLTEMQTRQPRLGYHLLFFLKVGKLNDQTMTTYRNFCASQENPSLPDSLFKDMQLLADDNRRLFAYLLPDIYTVFAAELTNNVAFLHLIVGTIDPTMCNTLICEIVRGHLNMFQSDDLSTVLQESLQWNSIEQFFFWQLVNAHEIPTRCFLPLVAFVDPPKHPEACANLILLFKLEKPTLELVCALLSRPGQNDALSVTALHFWSYPDNQHASRFASILKSMIIASLTPATPEASSANTSTGSREPRERRRNGARHQLPAEHRVELSLILTHLDAIRRNCRNIALLQDDDVQLALQAVVKSSDMQLSIKDHFSDLLALAEDQPSPPLIAVGAKSSTAPTETLPNDRLTGASDSVAKSMSLGMHTGRGVSMGSKGGHSLRNLDSRRAAEAERRQGPASLTGSQKRGSRAHSTGGQTNDEGADSDENAADAISVDDSSSSSSSNEEDVSSASGSPSSSDSSGDDEEAIVVGTKRSKHPKKRSSKSISVKSKRRSSPGSVSDRSKRTSSGTRQIEVDDDDDASENRLEVVVLEDDDSGPEELEPVRPTKRRKTSNRRYALDD